MSAIETLLRQPAAQAVGWALLQFVWQGAAVGALTALVLRAAAQRRRRALRRRGDRPRADADDAGGRRRPEVPVVAATNPAPPTSRHGRGGRAPCRSDPRGLASGRAAPLSASSISSPAASLLERVQSVRVEPLLPTLILVWLSGVACSVCVC